MPVWMKLPGDNRDVVHAENDWCRVAKCRSATGEEIMRAFATMDKHEQSADEAHFQPPEVLYPMYVVSVDGSVCVAPVMEIFDTGNIIKAYNPKGDERRESKFTKELLAFASATKQSK